ncbi:MAG: precorrin-3B C(17)-methyltransferase [Nitrospirota bacterium]
MDIANKSETRSRMHEDRQDSTVIFYITDNGRALAQKLRGRYPRARIEKFGADSLPALWNECTTLIFIMAAGIVVRTIAPLIKDKKLDPAVVVIDERGKFSISLLSGHIGGANERARQIAEFLGGEAVITTASDINHLPSIDLWAQENALAIEDWTLVPHIGTRFINNGALRVYSELDLTLPDQFLRVADPPFADIVITNKRDVYRTSLPPSEPRCPAHACRVKGQLYLRPKNLVLGIGCNSGTSAQEIEETVKNILHGHNLSLLSIERLATIDLKSKEPGLIDFAKKYGYEIVIFAPDDLNKVNGIAPSETVFKATGAYAVAEPAALLAAGADTLLISKQKAGNVTIAVAELINHKDKEKWEGKESERQESSASPIHPCTDSPDHHEKIYIVGTGPGSIEHITPYAQDAIRKSDVIVGYGTYLDLIQELIKDKEVVSTGMTQEVDRCKAAVELAESGKTVAVISGGDPGIYAMAGLVFELLKSRPQSAITCQLSVEVIPGISALNACASRLGAPLMHDFASISLSDRLTPWDVIERRLEAAAMADFVIALYNPKSRGRVEHINRAHEIIMKYRKPETPVGIVKGAMRENEAVVITDLEHMLDHDIDMQTTVIIGNSKTSTWNNLMITPRGYEQKGKY